MQRNRWTTVCNCRTTKGSFMISGADEMNNECRYKDMVLMKWLVAVCMIAQQSHS